MKIDLKKTCEKRTITRKDGEKINSLINNLLAKQESISKAESFCLKWGSGYYEINECRKKMRHSFKLVVLILWPGLHGL